MLDLKLIVKNTTQVKSKLKSRGFDVSIIDQITNLSKDRSKAFVNLQTLEAKRNKISQEISHNIKNKKLVASLKKQVVDLKKKIEKAKQKSQTINQKIDNWLEGIPNIPSDNVPKSLNQSANKVIEKWTPSKQSLKLNVLPHFEIGVQKEIIDFKNSVRMVGSRFWTYKNQGAKLVRALIDFMLETHLKKGYQELNLPLIVNQETMFGSGQLPKFKEDLFKIENYPWYLIPTSEVSLLGFYSAQILNLSKPIKITTYSPCFRAEAGSGGRDTRGIIRGHQFHKVELLKITTKEQAQNEYLATINDAKDILELLELPYRQVQLVTGDLGFSASETIDLEVWFPSEKTYREISSISLCGDFQSRRANIKYKDKDDNSLYAHTINGSGLAIDRTIVAIIENYQTNEGQIAIPKVLRKYFNNDKYFIL